LDSGQPFPGREPQSRRRKSGKPDNVGCGANLSVMTWSSRTGRNVTKVAAYRCTFREFQRKDRPIPESVVEIDRDGATVRERAGAAASTQAKYDGDSGYLVARAISSIGCTSHFIRSPRLHGRARKGVRDQRFSC
jgi:hypothetical protein